MISTEVSLSLNPFRVEQNRLRYRQSELHQFIISLSFTKFIS